MQLSPSAQSDIDHKTGKWQGEPAKAWSPTAHHLSSLTLWL